MRYATSSRLLCVLLLLASCARQEGPSPESQALKARLEQQTVGPIVWNLYTARNFHPVWIERDQIRKEKVQEFFRFVDDRRHGLHAERFGVDALRQEEHPDLIQFEIGVTSALARYAEAMARKDADVEKALNEAITSGSLGDLAARLAPVHAEYASLGNALLAASQMDRPRIELNMERWRKMPDNLGQRYVFVNIPAFELQVHEGKQIPLRMKVVVGTNDTRTPLLSSEMKHVVFSPYWNIPESIVTKEMLPKLRQNPDFLSRENLEVIRSSGKRIEVVDPSDVDWDDVDGREIQLRQKPGAKNSLGLVKFLFPNEYDVYLHDTPADSLFARNARNLSHGCVRVEKPQELAEYVLRDQPEWTSERIQTAMHAGEERHVALKAPLPVHIVYFTAWVDEEGELHLEKDIYGYDTEGTALHIK